MKTILVTGGNRGIGLEICRQLDELGHRVIMGSRNLAKGKKAAVGMSNNFIVKQLDVTSEESIFNLFEFARTEFDKLDVLINNAGIGENSESYKNNILAKTKNIVEKNINSVRQLNKLIVPLLRITGIIAKTGSAKNISTDKVKYIMETNLYGSWRMIQLFIPLLEKSQNGRIINISSGMGQLKGLSGYLPGYSMSKASLNALTIMFSNELKESGITVNAMCPGWVKTDMGGVNAPLDVSQGADTAIWLATEEDLPTGKFFKARKEIEW